MTSQEIRNAWEIFGISVHCFGMLWWDGEERRHQHLTQSRNSVHVSYPCHPITTRVRTETATNVFGREQQLRNEVETEAKKKKTRRRRKLKFLLPFPISHLLTQADRMCASLSHAAHYRRSCKNKPSPHVLGPHIAVFSVSNGTLKWSVARRRKVNKIQIKI